MPDTEKEMPPVITIHGDTERQMLGRPPPSLGQVLPWLLGVCVCCFLALMAAGVYEALSGSPVFRRATPTPAFSAGLAVKLAGQEEDAVTVWQVGGDCEVGLAFGQVLSGTDARVLEEACYHRKRRTTLYRIALANDSTGWVEAGDLVPAAEYTPPAPTATPKLAPTATPWPTSKAAAPTLVPTPMPPLAPLPVGSPFSAGAWRVRVDRVETADALSSAAGDKTVAAEGRFALVYLTATNQGAGPATLHASSVWIEDDAGTRYLNHDLASAYASSGGCNDFALDIATGESVCLVAAIDISAEGSIYLLSLQGADEVVLLEVP